ncbi:hypothetical protein DFH11DRAFT_590589 [Phellopilus nigrolimitatus]|nr:hypothetical protein DFH11DRAFT_590589 [Phellopilus nigrolimitatus]
MLPNFESAGPGQIALIGYHDIYLDDSLTAGLRRTTRLVDYSQVDFKGREETEYSDDIRWTQEMTFAHKSKPEKNGAGIRKTYPPPLCRYRRRPDGPYKLLREAGCNILLINKSAWVGCSPCPRPKHLCLPTPNRHALLARAPSATTTRSCSTCTTEFTDTASQAPTSCAGCSIDKCAILVSKQKSASPECADNALGARAPRQTSGLQPRTRVSLQRTAFSRLCAHHGFETNASHS